MGTGDELGHLGADAVISLDQVRESLIASYRSLWSNTPVDVVLDYLWGEPAEILLQAIGQKGLQQKAPRLRYVQIGSIAGATANLSGTIFRSSGLELLGSGFGSASTSEILESIGEFFQAAARTTFSSVLATASLKDVREVWTKPDRGARFVFVP